MIKRYKRLKFVLQLMAFFNVALIALGVVAAADYLQNHSPSAGAVLAVATAVFWIGFVLPYYFFKKIEKSIEEKQEKVQKHLSFWIAEWLKQKEKEHGESVSFEFWLKFAMASVEVLELRAKNPYFQFLIDMMPLISKNLNDLGKSSSSSKKKRSA